ncbi:putative vacuolar segregation protein PEP7 [Apostichopus japonicus]|uniref:Putative vacuolar segregation protein PEP7 n=1 Tax=Stichopus japonicus TaxID=307972 RepID=A0A2G8KC81_STIJA|nr:putative vacuolar segregation protein PEP7 [Apostichopus japonicus]
MRVFSNLPLGVTPLVLEDHCQSPVEGGEEALFQVVERWDGEEPTSPILFDPDGDFILLPRPEQVCFQDKEAFSSLSEPTPFPVHVFVHSAVLNTLQSVPDYPHRFQVYLKEGLSNLKSSKVSEGQTISSTPSSKEQGTEPQTVSEAEPITTNDTPLLRSPTETGWFRSFNTKTSSLKRTKETASADTENPLDTVSDSAREVSVPLKGGDFLEEDEKASAVSDSDLTLDAHGDDLTDARQTFQVNRFIATFGKISRTGSGLKHDTFSSDQDADISSALDKSVEEDGSDYDECQIGQEEEIKEEVKDSTDESEQITDLEFEHLQDVFSAAKAVPKIKPSKLKFWQLVPYVYLGTIKPNNTEHGLKKATSLDSVVSEPLSPSIPVHEEEGVNFVDTNDNFKKFIIGNQRLHIDVDRLKRFATTGMAEGISSSGQSGTDVKSGGILGFVRGSKSDAQNSLKQNESGLQPTSSIDLDGTDSRKGELTESDIDISSSIAIKEDIDQGQQLELRVETKSSDIGSASLESSVTEEKSRFSDFKRTTGQLRTSFRRKLWRERKLPDRDKSGTDSRKDETEVNESATTSINEDIDKGQQLDYRESKASDRPMVADEFDNERSGSVSLASSQSVIKEEEKEQEEEEGGTKLKNFKKTASHLRSSFRRKLRKEEKLTGDNNGTDSRKDETEVNESATTSINEDIDKDQQLDYGGRKASDRFMVTDEVDNERSGSVSLASSQSVSKEEEKKKKKEGTKLMNFKKTASHLRSSFRRKLRKEEKLTGDDNGIESRKEDVRETDDVDVKAPTSVSEDIELDMKVSSGAQLDSREKKLPDTFVATDEVAGNENSGSANLVSLQSETKEGKGKTRLTDLMERTDKLRSSIKRKIGKEEKLSGSKSESGIEEVRETDVDISAMAAVSQDNEKDQLAVSTNEEAPSSFPDTFEKKNDSCISEATQSSSEKETGNKVGNFVRGTRERLSLVRRGKKKKDQFLIPETAKQAGKPSEIDKTLPVDDKSEDEEYDVFDNSGKSSGNTEELQFTFKKDRQTKLGRSTSERKLSRRPGKGLRRSESDMQVFYKPRNTTNRKESLDGIDQPSLTTMQERLLSNFTTIIEGKSDEEKSDLISIPTSPSTSKEKTETTVGSFVRGEWVVVSQGSPTVGDDPVSNEQIDQTSPPAGKEEEEESPKDEVSLKKAPNVLLSPFRKIGKRRDSSQEEGIGTINIDHLACSDRFTCLKHTQRNGAKCKTLDIAATNDSLARAQSYQHQVDSKRLKKEWSSTRDDVESFVGTAAKSLSDGYGLWKLSDQDDDREDSILTSHWEKSKNHKNCQGCQTSFSALARFRRSSKRGHCRKCGQVFCNGCLGYMRKLNTFAQYDPSGKECKVCKHCHNPETAPVTEGMTSSHLELFKKHRDNFKHYGWDIELASEQYRFEPTVSSMLRQCKKLEKGFQGSVSGKSGLKVPNLALMKKNIPDWQKPPTWVDPSNKDITGCQLCSRSKLLPGSLHNCRICGRRVCSQDSSSDFLLYIPDRGTVEYSPENSTRWKIIRIVGCPQTEPAICMYLRVCFTCKGKLSTLQEETFQHFRLSLSDEYELCMLMLQGIHKETQQMKSSILECMPKFIDAVDMLGKDSKNITETQRKSLANHQDNLMDQFPKFIMAVNKLRDITPKTEQQVRLVGNVLQEKWAFYRDNVANFRIRGRQLMEIMPEEEIKQLKYIVNREAINCACLIVTQLAFEVLHISMQKNLSESFAMTLKDIGEIIEQELEQMITSSTSGESWEDHKEDLYAYVKNEMKSDRRFLKLMRRKGRRD